jgi:hypothetical protein
VIAASSSVRHRKEDPKVEAVGTAQLTDRIPAHRAVAANFSSREIRDVLRDADATPELTLEVVAREGSREHGTISMAWSRNDLEKLLEGASGDDIVLTFDRNELMAALDDVETHGLRTRAAVFAVAALGAAGGSAVTANAAISGADAGIASTPAATAPAYTDVSSGGYAATSQSDNPALAALQARSEAMNAEYAGGGSASDAAAALEARSAGMNAEYAGGGSAEAALQARSQGLDEQFGLTAADRNATSALEARGAAMNAEYGLGDLGSTDMVTDASSGGYTTPTATDVGGGGISIQAPSTEDALIAGAALLAIAGAGFAARRGTLHLP